MSKKLLDVILVAAMIVELVFFGCSKKPTRSKSNWITYNTSNSGIASNYVKAIAIDASGNKWFGTSLGGSKFDGKHWKTYDTSNSGLANDWVLAIAIDSSGNIWFGTNDGGVSKFHE
jgi:ligand-binding sensor domain-containing protein